MKILKIIALGGLIVIAAFLIFVATRPDTFLIQRSATINAPAEKIAPLISDFHSWVAWSPYEKLDPAMKKTFSGAQNGKGAVYEWSGNQQAGQGRMEITEASTSLVTIKTDFVKPMKASDIIEFKLVPNGPSTNVTWSIRGPNPFIGKLMGVFFNIDQMVGKDFEAGLASLKAVAEK